MSPLALSIHAEKPPIVRVEAAADGARWAAEHRAALRAAVVEHGSLLVRGCELADADAAGAICRQLGSVMVETETFAPRRTYGEGVYSSSLWPASEPMCMHHELSYRLEFPGLMLFACLTPPTEGGATLVADARAVYRALPAELIDRFAREGWLLIRQFGNDVGVSLSDAFGADDRLAVEDYCRANAIAFEWQPGGTLRTWQRRSAIVRHPITGESCWFNQIAFLNEETMDAEVREYLRDVHGENGLPFTTRFGNGDPIGAGIVELINDVYAEHTVREPWEAGDLLLVDNIRTAHAREPFTGSREIVVAMADAVRLADCAPTFAVTPVSPALVRVGKSRSRLPHGPTGKVNDPP
jgi:hypothetical protein